MLQQKLKKRIIGILLFLLVFCIAIAIMDTVAVSAGAIESHEVEAYNEQSDSNNASLSAYSKY